MKRLLAITLAFSILFSLAACTPGEPAPSTGENPTAATEEISSGWQTIDGNRYCFSAGGDPLTGWLTDNGERYYLDSTGMALTGWQDVAGKRYYFAENGAMHTGWLELNEQRYYFGMDGSLFTGLLNIEGKGYYFSEDGTPYSGWLELDGKTYYFDESGVMAVGPTQIGEQTHYFSPHGVKMLLVNPWNTVPEDYTVELLNVTERDRLETECAEALQRLIADCEAAGHTILIVSAYRTHEEQEYLYWRKVRRLEEAGWSHANALTDAAKEVAIPGTSEHQLGLAVDLVDAEAAYLDDRQADTDTQKWLMEHCHEYGFILRYPVGSTQITGIIYEPWHYRYVGQEIAQEIANLGITLEEYLGAA
jgi:LAS superfamily LD-carboxypeptidase LdcB/YHS domain-containing protein